MTVMNGVQGAWLGSLPASCLRRMHPKRVGEGTALFRRGQALAHVFAVLHGVVQVSRGAAPGLPKIIGVALDGDVIGCDALATGTYGGDALVVRDSVLWVIDPRRCAPRPSGTPRAPELARLAEVQMARMMRQETRLRLAGLSRVADLLLQLAEQGGRTEVELPLDCRGIANYLGLRPETLSRVLRQLGDTQCLRRVGRLRFDVDLARLRQVRALRRTRGPVDARLAVGAGGA